MERLRILLVTPFPPRIAGTHGGAKAIGQLLAGLSQRHAVGVLTFRHPSEPGVDAALSERLSFVQEVPRADEPGGAAHLVRALRRRGAQVRGTPLWVSELPIAAGRSALRGRLEEWQPDVVQFELAVTGVLAQGLRAQWPARVLVDHDPLLSTIRVERRLDALLDERAWNRYLRRADAAVDAVVTLTERDRQAVVDRGTARKVVTIPLGFELGETLDSAGREDELVFVGNLNHPANREAVAHIDRELLPRIATTRPGIRVTVVGEPPASAALPSSDPRLHFTGLVDDVRPFVDAAAVVLAPLNAGGGMRVKVLEALAAGKALVAYPNALEGIYVTPGRDALVVSTPDEFARSVVSLLDDPARRRELGHNARAWAGAHAGWEHSIDRYDALYRSLRN